MQRDVMIILLPVLTSYGLIRRVRVSLPLVPALVADRPGKYALPENLPPPESRADLQPLGRQRLYHPDRSPATPRRRPRKMSHDDSRLIDKLPADPVA
jgi:hypothetical protein